MLAAGLVGVLALSGALAFRQVRYWRDGMTLFARAVAVTESNYIMHGLYGRELNRAGRRDEAVAELERAVEIRPDDARYRVFLAQIHLQRGAHGDLALAERQLQRVLETEPDNEDARRLQRRLRAASRSR